MSRYSHNLTTPPRDLNPPDSISHPQIAPNSYLSDHPIPTTKTSFLDTPTFNFHPNSPSYLHSPTHISFLSQQPYLLIPPLQVQLNPLLRERDVRVNVRASRRRRDAPFLNLIGVFGVWREFFLLLSPPYFTHFRTLPLPCASCKNPGINPPKCARISPSPVELAARSSVRVAHNAR